MTKPIIQILTVESEFESAKTLEYPTFINEDEINPNELVLRWGRGWLDYRFEEFPHIINPYKNIKRNVNKILAREYISKAVKMPKLFLDKIPAKVKAVLRYKSHTSGEDFELVIGPKDIPHNHYATEFIKTEKEYRCWWAFGETLCARRIAINTSNKKIPCRSEWGYAFIGEDQCTILRRETLAAAKEIGLETGAADVLWKNGYYFLELNSAPSIDHRIIRKFFQKAINKRLKQKELV